jgi:hypothetical protein
MLISRHVSSGSNSSDLIAISHFEELEDGSQPYPLHSYTGSDGCWSSVLRSNGSDLYFSSALPLVNDFDLTDIEYFGIVDPTTIVAPPPDIWIS